MVGDLVGILDARKAGGEGGSEPERRKRRKLRDIAREEAVTAGLNIIPEGRLGDYVSVEIIVTGLLEVPSPVNSKTPSGLAIISSNK